MARYFPTGEPSPRHPLLSFTFLIAFIASIVAIVSSLCGFTKKKQPTSPTIGNPTLDEEQTQNLEVRTEEETKKKKADNPFLSNSMRRETEIEPLPPPPGMGKLRASSYHVRSNSNVSQIEKLSSSMSMRSIGGFKKAAKKEVSRHTKNKMSHEDSIWKKTIILGEKCRVPDDEEDAVVYDEKGMRIPTFHRKQSKGLQISRQNSTQ